MTVRIVFVNRFFWPDESATSQILSDVAFDLAAHNRRVTIVTSQLSYSDPDTRFRAAEIVAGVQVIRVRTLGSQRTLPSRALAFASFYVATTIAAWRLLQRGDVLIAKTDPPLLSIPMMLVARWRGARFATWLQDIYPELAGVLGMAIARGVPGRLLARLRDISLRRADANVVIGERMRALLRARGIPDARITIIPNWTDDRAITPDPPGYPDLRKHWGFDARDTVVGYSGNLGRAHDVDTMLEAAATLQTKGRSDIRFLFVGSGKLRERLISRATMLGLTNIVCRPYVERHRLAEALAVADIHWLTLHPELEGMIVPSKFYGIAASGRPALFVGAPDGEIGRLLADHDAGFSFMTGDTATLAATIERLADDPALRVRLGRNGRRALDMHYSQQAAIAAWRAVADRLAGGPPHADAGEART